MAPTTTPADLAQAIREQAARLTALVATANEASAAHFARRSQQVLDGTAVAGATTHEWEAAQAALWTLAGASERMVSLLVEADLA